MMNFDPLAPVGMLIEHAAEEQRLLGTCFLFRREDVALAAAHCIPDDVDASVVLPRLARTQAVVSVERHPSADIALIRTEAVPGANKAKWSQHAFWDRVHRYSLGEEFSSHGYPVEGEEMRTLIPEGQVR